MERVLPRPRSIRLCWAAGTRAVALAAFGACVALRAMATDAPTGEGVSARPLAAPGAAATPTLFTLVPAAESGVRTENKYADPRMWGDRYQEFLFGALGTGIAVGDYDGDGRPDLFVVSKTESCRLFRNLGGFKFEEVTAKAGVGDAGAAAGVWKQGATFVDINNDGRLDLYVCRFNAPNLLYVNQGDGTFREEARARGLDVVDACGMAYFADYDRDGALDVYLATNLLDNTRSPRGQRGILLHNRGDGTFANATDRAGITDESQSHSAAWWDFDNDGWPDLYVANDYGAPDKLYRNNHDGTFTDRLRSAAPRTSFSSMGSDVGDANNDGRIDLIVGDMAASTHAKDQRGAADLRSRDAETPEGADVTAKYRHNALLLNTGTPRLLEGAYLAGLAVSDWTWAIRFEDLDNDGRLDLFACNGMIKEENMDVNARMMQAESSTERIRIMRESPLLLETNRAFRNVGELEFKDVSAEWGVDQRTISFGAAFGDFDGDGDLDIAYANYQASAALLRNDGTSGHRVEFELRGTRSNRFGIGAVVRIDTAKGSQVRQLWLGRGYMSSSEPMVHFGLGEAAIIDRVTVTWPSGIVQTVTQLAADQHYTITEPTVGTPPPAPSDPAAQFAETSNASGLRVGSQDERFDETATQRLLPFRLNRRGPGVAVGDLNADGRDDLVVAGTTLTQARVLLATGTGQFSAASGSPFVAGDHVDDGPPLIVDADGDGRADLLQTKAGSSLPAGAPDYQPRLLLGDGHGAFQPAPGNPLPEFPASVGAVVAADFDRDGRLDLFMGARVLPGMYPLAPRSALWANRGGRFEDVTATVAPGLREVGMVTSAVWSDVDGDGWPDLVVALDWGGVKYFHNQQGRMLEDWSERAGFAAAGTGWWTALATADFNGDGRPDFAAGNAGLNSPYQPAAGRPLLLFSGDFRGDEQPQLVEAYYEGDRLYPRRSRRDLGSAIPAVARKYPKNDLFARATLGEILGDAALAAAEKFTAAELRSGVFLSQPDGTYRFAALPRIAQIAPLQGMVAGDFDGDGKADLYAVQNSYAPVPAIGRFNGGVSQLLRGDGRGHFTAVPPATSGLVVPGDAKALVTVDLDDDGWPDFFVSRNNDATLAFRNRGVAGSAAHSIRLVGPRGNPTAIGARVTIAYRDGSSLVAEVGAGGGYASQSTTTIFAGGGPTHPITRITVRWPDGKESVHPAPASAAVVIAEP